MSLRLIVPEWFAYVITVYCVISVSLNLWRFKYEREIRAYAAEAEPKETT